MHDSKSKNCVKQKKSMEFNSKMIFVKGNPMTNKEKSTTVSITATYKNEEKIVQEEILVYDTAGMISQMGGIISLFIGISFFSIGCDVLDFVKNKI